MPGRRAYRYWQATDAAFAESVLALRRRRDQQIGVRGRARLRAWDPALGDRIIVAVHKGATLAEALAGDPALPCLPVVRRWRREQPEFDRVLRMMISARRAAVKPVPEFLVEEVVDHIVEGGSFASFSRVRGAPSQGTLRRWLRDPNFAEAVAQACEWREDWYQDRIEHIARRTPPGPVREMNRAVGPLLRHLVRLRHRPGAVHRAKSSPRPKAD